VPGLQEFPGGPAEGQRLVAAILTNVKCEVQDAIDDLHRVQKKTFIDDWAVQVSLSLQVSERTAVAPAAVWSPPSPASSLFILSGGGNASAEATRINKVGSFYTVRELMRIGRCHPEARPNGPFLLQSNLKLNEWLVDTVTVGNIGAVDFARSVPDKDVIQHQVKFEVVSGVSANPTWVLTRVAVNPAGTTLFAASRNRTHDLTITLGPVNLEKIPGLKPRLVPSRAAANAALAADIGIAVGNGVKRAGQ